MNAANGPVLVADVGGTHVRFALVDVAAAEPIVAGSDRRFRAAEFAGFSDAARRYLDETASRPKSIVIAAAGPRVGGEVRLTNLPWVISSARIEAAFGFKRATLINDFAAMALSVPLLKRSDLRPLGAPEPPALDAATSRAFAIVGPGTGLGVGALLVRDARLTALETEGGHAGFAPGDAEEIEILRRLAARFGRVSNERLLCGSGLLNLYEVLCEIGGTPVRMSTPEDVTRHADDDDDCRRAVERFCAILGSVAGDLALVFGAWDGVYLTGGLAPRLEHWLAAGAFRTRFEAKGRFASAMARVPASIVLHADAGLLGAAAFALIESGRSVLALER
jgi:glucokinase